MLLSTVAATIRSHQMFGRGQRVGVAVSGGADSVCLLHVLLELAPEWDLRLAVLHLNHGLRGEESCQDERFVRDLAGRLGVPVIVRSVNVAASRDNLEQAGRRARLAFFHEQIAAGDVARVATGHTLNDQAETTLFRFLRGAGGAGLAGIRVATSEGLVRPLLEVTRAEVEEYLRERGIAWREDSSNADRRFARNRIRHQLLPQLAAEWNPAIVETLGRAADWAAAEEQYWEEEIGRLAAQFRLEGDGSVLVRTEVLRQLPLAAARRLVRHALETAKGDLLGIGFEHIAEILRIALSELGHGRVQVPGAEVERSLDWVRFVNSLRARRPFNNYQLQVTVPDVVPIPGTARAIALELFEKTETIPLGESVYNSETGWVDWRVVSGSLEIRNWRPGDQYQPAGSAGEERIKTLFQKARIPRWERRHWPVMTNGSAIVWAAGFGVAAPFAANPASTRLLRIRETEAAAEFGIGDSSSGV
ncbi:MAG TPA: tRNA lysidine(34) synthetase TilS [Bryobacteraceae bacterium]|nr:tRNA lysidine(34) synthetase TilS [Bryobacteraceae bacterium]